MLSIERSRSTRKAGIVTLIGVLVVPLLVAGGFLAATYHSQDRLSRVQAAVVNLDDPVRLNGQLVPLGRQLAGGLVNGSDDIRHQAAVNFSWVLSDRADAASGLASGRYAAVVTIPKSFSADATSYAKASTSKNAAADAQHATLQVQTSQVTGVTDPAVAQAISSVAVSSLNKTLTKSYLENIYLGFNDTKKQFSTVADGAAKLADGATQLSGGLDKSAAGTGTLADGMQQLSTGAGQLSSGVSQTSTGVSGFAAGLHQLDDGAQKLAGGVGSLDTGATALANGLGRAATGAQKLAKGATQLDTGLTAYADGASTYAVGAKTYATGVSAYARQGSTLAGGAQQYSAGVSQAYTALRSTTSSTLDGVCGRTGMNATQCAAVKQAVGAVDTGVFKGDGSGRNPGLIAGAAGLSTGVGRYTGAAGALATGAGKLSAGASALATNGQQLSAGLDTVTGGLGALGTGLGKSATGAKQLAGGVGKLDTGASALAGGTAQSAAGADRLAAGVSKLDAGASQLAVGVSRSSGGVDQLHTGLVKLSDGGDQLASGTTKLADGLAKGARQIPTYTTSDRVALASVVAAPVDHQQPDSLFSDATTTTLLALLALWLGGLVTFLVVRAVPAEALGSAKSTVRLTLEALAPGAAIAAVQAAVFSVVLQRLLHLSAGDYGAALGFLVFTAVTFTVVNHALVAWFGGFGRLLSALALAVVAAAALTSAVPAVIDTLRPVLPLSPGLDGLRALVTGAGGTAHAVGVLLGWLVVGLIASVVAVARTRVLKARTVLDPLPA